MQKHSGKFITLEGIDGCGKGTQVEKLKEYFKDRKDVVFMREPGGEPISEKIRELILDNKNEGMVDLTEFLLFSASRAQLTKNKIIPLLKSGKTIICERYSDSSLVYQGFARGLDVLEIMTVNKIATFDLKPDITIYFELSPEVSFSRTSNRGNLDRIEKAGLEFQKKCFAGYEFAKDMFADRYVTINANQSPDKVFEDLKSVLTKCEI